MLVLVPAYGRDYKTADQVLAAWAEKKDFLDLLSGRYVNIDDCPGDVVAIEFHRRQKVVYIDKNA